MVWIVISVIVGLWLPMVCRVRANGQAITELRMQLARARAELRAASLVRVLPREEIRRDRTSSPPSGGEPE